MLVVAQDAQSRDVEQQPGRGGDIEAHPRHCDGAEDVSMCERKHATAAGLSQADELERSGVDLRRRLAPRASVFVNLPCGPRLVDRFGGYAFVFAVVELAKKGRELMVWKACDLGSARRTQERTRIDNIKIEARESSAERCRLLLAVFRQGKVGAAGVAAVESPFRLAMSGEVDLERQAGFPIISGLPERSDRLALSMTAPALTRCPGRIQTSPTAA